MNEKSPTRRDWFRLKRVSGNAAESQAKRTDHRPRLLDQTFNRLPLPPNPAGLDREALPPMCEAMLDAGKVADLAADIAESAEEVSVLLRSSSGGLAGDNKKTAQLQLNTAFSALLSGDVNRLQVRYRWNGANWIDTLERRGGEFRLVRVRHGERTLPG